MADVGPEVEAKTLGHDLAIAKPDDLRPRHPLAQTFEHRFLFFRCIGA
jgi:hypothetical protein